MYRTLRKYRAGIVSITQNLADYGDEAFAKMIFTNSFTKIFLQNGAAAEFLKETFDLPESDIARALSVTSKKPIYSEFFALSPTMSQVFRLYPTPEFYNTKTNLILIQQFITLVFLVAQVAHPTFGDLQQPSTAEINSRLKDQALI